MKVIITIVVLLLIGGCTNSFSTCDTLCKSVNKEDFKYIGRCESLESVIKSLDEEYDCQLTNRSELRKYCFNECKGQRR